MTALRPWLWAVVAAAVMWLHFADALYEPIHDPDVFWQLWAGEQMLDGRFPRHNDLSYTAPDYPWTPHEPLVALCYAAVGLERVGAVRIAVVGLTVVLLCLLAHRRDSAWATLGACVWCVALIHFGTTERALTWANLWLAAVAWLTSGEGGKRPWRLVAATAVVWLWASVHGSFPIGVLMLLLVDWRYGLAAAAATAINPSGLEVYRLLLHYGPGGDASQFIHRIPEWMPPSPSHPMAWVRVACALLAGWLVFRERRWRALALWAALAALSLRHQRFFDLLAVAMLPHVARALAARVPGEPIRAAWLLFAEAWIIAALFALPVQLDEALYPSGIADGVDDDARSWHDFQLGGWLGHQGVPVFWDTRNDCYPLEILRDGNAVEHLHGDWEEVLVRWEVDTVVTRQQDVADALIARGWRLERAEGSVSLLSRR
jgi:hypothetical protein